METDVKWAFYTHISGTDKTILLDPLTWKSGDQLSDLKKILEFFENYRMYEHKTKILIYKSTPGSGKSSTLLHVVENLGRGLIVAPFKNLQRQYYNDYFIGDKFVMKKDGSKLRVSVIVGRGNFQCRWLEEQYAYQQKLIEESKKEENVGRYIPIDDRILSMYRTNSSCANRYLPCTRSLRIIMGRSGKGSKETRWMAGCECPYWIPTPMARSTIIKWKDKTIDDKGIETDFEVGDIENKSTKTRLDFIQDKIKCHEIKYYESIGWGDTAVFIRDDKDINGKPCPDVCPYYKQFYSYVDADVIIMNDAKWYLETNIGRKPKMQIEIFDEGDYWLDNRAIEIDFPRFNIDKIIPSDNKTKRLKDNTLSLFDIAVKDIKDKIQKNKEGPNLTDAKAYRELFLSMTNMFLEYKKVVEEDDVILQKIFDIATVLRYIDKASISFQEGKREETKILKLFIPFPDNLLKDLFGRSSKNIIITSGTIQSDFVLDNLFGINNDNYITHFVQGRKDNPGKLICIKPKEGLLKVNHTTWQSPQFREKYYQTLNYILDQLKVHIDAKTGRPGEAKILILTPAKRYVQGILDRPDVFIDFARSKDEEDNLKMTINTSISDFVNKNLEDVRKVKDSDIELDGNIYRTDQQIIISTRMTRGADLRDDKCRAVVMTKWPMSDISAGYNQALKKRFGENIYWAIMKDKAEREAIQYVSRGLRHEFDWEYFSTPDDTSFDRVYMLFTYD